MTPIRASKRVTIGKGEERRAPVLRSSAMNRPDAGPVEMHRLYPVDLFGERKGYLYRNVYGNHAWILYPFKGQTECPQPVMMGPALSADEAKRTCMALVATLWRDPSEAGIAARIRLYVCKWCGAEHAFLIQPGANNQPANWCWTCGSTRRDYERII